LNFSQGAACFKKTRNENARETLGSRTTAAGSLREEEEKSFERRASVRRVLHLDDSHRGFFGEVLLKMVCYI
jgi:hypothetical protein